MLEHLIIYQGLILILHKQIRNIIRVEYVLVLLMDSPGYNYPNDLEDLVRNIQNLRRILRILYTQIHLLYYNMGGKGFYLYSHLHLKDYLTHVHVKR